MKNNIIRELVNLALNKNAIKDKLLYLFKALIYIIPLVLEQRSSRGKDEDDELLGDDIYPLF
jgi:hypothetical protein